MRISLYETGNERELIKYNFLGRDDYSTFPELIRELRVKIAIDEAIRQIDALLAQTSNPSRTVGSQQNS